MAKRGEKTTAAESVAQGMDRSAGGTMAPEQVPDSTDPAQTEAVLTRTRMRTTFETESMGDLADYLIERAEGYETRAKHAKLVRDRKDSTAKAEGLREAADVVKRTTIVPAAPAPEA